MNAMYLFILFSYQGEISLVNLLKCFLANTDNFCPYEQALRRKKIPAVPVSYREKIRVGRSEIKCFFEYFFHGFGVFLLGDLQ
jgi:hypothetical protein